jgi:dTDP-4-dehydrorhamnose 3,5-epimerase
MKFRESFIKGVFEITPKAFEDERGYFFESYQEKVFAENGINDVFVQDNQSFSKKGVLRGLHFQKSPHAQSKLVGVLWGSVIDVVVDIRPQSPTFGQYDIFEIDVKKNNRVYIPTGMAHGFMTLEDAIFAYKCGDFYHPTSEYGILWNDPTLGIDWKNTNPIVSSKDLLLPTWEELSKTYFV